MKKIGLLFCFSLSVLLSEAQIVIYPIVKNTACGNSGGGADAFVAGGTAPYAFSWNTGVLTSSISNLSVGYYRVYVMDALGDTASEPIGVFNDNFIETTNAFFDYDLNSNFYYSCRTICNGGYRLEENYLNGTLPYLYTSTGTQNVTVSGVEFLGFCTGDSVLVTISDANGCLGRFSEILYGPTRPEMRVLNVKGACDNGANGAAVFRIPAEGGGFTGNINYSVFSPSGGFSLVQPSSIPGIYQSDYLAFGHYYLTRFYDSGYINCDDDSIEFDIPDLGDKCATINGFAWEDSNADCVRDTTERGISGQMLKILPGSSYVFTNELGFYSLTLPFGNYTIEWVNPSAPQTCPSGAATPFSLTSLNPYSSLDFANAPNSSTDLLVLLNAGQGTFTAGSTFSAFMQYKNRGSSASDPAKLYYYFDPLATFQSASIAPDSIGSNVLMWNLGVLPAGNVLTEIEMSFSLSAGAVSGYYWKSSASITLSPSDIDASNNSAYLNNYIASPFFDTNKKFSSDAWGNKGNVLLINLDNTIYYSINFKNTTGDTAYYLNIIDTLSSNLDLSTFRLLSSSSLCIASIDSARKLKINFPSIQLPTSSVNEIGSRGFVNYSIDAPLSFAGTQAHVLNKAEIYFDTYAPFETNLSDVLIDVSVGIVKNTASKNIQLYPNPVQNIIQLRLDTKTALDGKAQIFSIDGRMVQEEMIREVETNFNTSGFTSGTYLFRYTSKEGENYNLLFVKE